MENKDRFILKPFNALYWVLLAATFATLFILTALLKNLDLETKKIAFCILCCLTFTGFFAYKYFLSKDMDYRVIRKEYGGFNWWNELPLQLCNINMILMPIAVLMNEKGLLSFCFYIAPLGALMAVSMPVAGFDKYSIFLPRMLGFYGTHYAIIVESLLLLTLGFYRPQFADLTTTIIMAAIISFVVHLINLFIRKTGRFEHANYFYTMEREGNPVLEFFYKLIPFDYFYLAPCALILFVYVGVIVLFLKYVLKY